VRPLAFLTGFGVSLAAILLVGEGFARFSLPRDIREHLTQGSAQKGPFRPDPVLGATYRSYEAFATENSMRLRQQGPLDWSTPTWLFFGNSFVQAEGMIAETMARLLPEMRIFALRENVLLPLRAAQARLLLEAGLRPERIFFVVLPIDLLQIGQRPLAFISVNEKGVIGTRLRWPDAPWGDLVSASRLATIAWIRSGRANGDPGFNKNLVATAPSPRVLDDLSRILGHLAESSYRFNVPVTIVAIPDRDQIFGRLSFRLQDEMRQMSRRLKLDFYDAHEPLLPVSDKRSLFLTDWHFLRARQHSSGAWPDRARSGPQAVMSFVKVEFFYFLPIAFGVWTLLRRNYAASLGWLLVASLLFYGFNQWWLILILISYCLADWLTGLWLQRTRWRRFALATGIGFNLLVLCF
jgi:hypothetical protein